MFSYQLYTISFVKPESEVLVKLKKKWIKNSSLHTAPQLYLEFLSLSVNRNALGVLMIITLDADIARVERSGVDSMGRRSQLPTLSSKASLCIRSSSLMMPRAHSPEPMLHNQQRDVTYTDLFASICHSCI
jgi:hypothetical protein